MNPSSIKLWRNSSLILGQMFEGIRNHSSKSKRTVDLRKLRPMIMKRIQERAKDYPVKTMLPVAREVLQTRNALYGGVAILIQHFPILVCRHCPEVYIGEAGHLIRTCHGYRRYAKNKVHNWVRGSINDILVPVETFHLQKMFQNVIKHNERFDHQRNSAIIELCQQAGVDYDDPSVSSSVITHDGHDSNDAMIPESLSKDELRWVATRTLRAWETLQSGVHKLLTVYPAKVCSHCSEVHVGPSGHKARMCGVFKYESWHGTHLWKKARVDDLVPPKIVWHKRRQDPMVLVDEGREYYGRAPAVVDLCSKGGALAPSKYSCLMKIDGLAFHVETNRDSPCFQASNEN